MADGPTVINSGSGGTTAIIAVLAVVAIVLVLVFTGVIDFRGTSGAGDVNVKVDAPATMAPAAPAAPAPAAPAAPAPAAPAAPAN